MKNHLKDKILTAYNLNLPNHLMEEMAKAKKLEIITVAYLVSVVILMFVTLSSSQAMKAAWIEDMLGMIPSIVFLISAPLFNRKATFRFPYGFHRIFSIGYAFGAFALLGIGLFIIIDSSITLINAEHPTIPHKRIFGREIWFGWIMILVLFYSFIPTIILGIKKIPKALKLHNKLLYVDSETQKADWLTAIAAIAGIIGIGFGIWWADAAAAIFISINILKDGINRTSDSIKDLLGQIPTKVENEEPSPENEEIIQYLSKQKWIKDSRIRLREEGQVFAGEAYIVPVSEKNLVKNISALQSGLKNLNWKFNRITIQPVENFNT